MNTMINKINQGPCTARMPFKTSAVSTCHKAHHSGSLTSSLPWRIMEQNSS
jgi:hypothetical protein